MLRRTLGNVDCSYSLDDDRLAAPSDKELRALIAQCRKACPDGAHLQAVDIRFDEAGAQAIARFQGCVRISQPRQGATIVKPERYTLYDAAELVEARQRRRFYNTWQPCSVCRRSPRKHPTGRIEKEWMCRECCEGSVLKT